MLIFKPQILFLLFWTPYLKLEIRYSVVLCNSRSFSVPRPLSNSISVLQAQVNFSGLSVLSGSALPNLTLPDKSQLLQP